MALLANYPIAIAPGMGLNAYLLPWFRASGGTLIIQLVCICCSFCLWFAGFVALSLYYLCAGF
jgi:hypothetical protein